MWPMYHFHIIVYPKTLGAQDHRKLCTLL